MCFSDQVLSYEGVEREEPLASGNSYQQINCIPRWDGMCV